VSDALTFSGVDAYYGDSLVLREVSFCLREGCVLGLLGRNGAGKTTCMNVAVGLLTPRRGEIALFSSTVTGAMPEDLAHLGIALVPQGRRVFKSLSVGENLSVAHRTPAWAKQPLWTHDTVYAAFPRLKERKRQIASSLSGGEQQMLAIGRALMSNPRVLLMDEPSEGLAPQIVAEVIETVGELKAQGLSIMLVEQNPKLVLGIADDVVVLNSGRVAVSGSVDELEGLDLREHLGVY
jgi:branched-chain amino acid transport system ATP-binding protein